MWWIHVEPEGAESRDQLVWKSNGNHQQRTHLARIQFLNNPTGGEIMPVRILSNLWPVQCELSFTMNSKIPESWHWMQGVSVLPIVTHRSACSISTQLLVWSQKMQLRLCQTMKCWFNQYQALICTWKRVNKWRLAPHPGVWLVMWLGHLYHGTFR